MRKGNGTAEALAEWGSSFPHVTFFSSLEDLPTLVRSAVIRDAHVFVDPGGDAATLSFLELTLVYGLVYCTDLVFVSWLLFCTNDEVFFLVCCLFALDGLFDFAT